MRSRVSRSVLGSGVAITALLVLSGCSGEGGTPSPATGSISSAPRSSSTLSSPAATGVNGLSACDLFTAEEAKKIGVSGAGTDNGSMAGSGTSRCEWSKPFVGGEGGFTLSIVVRPAQGIETVDVGPGTTKEEGGFQGRKAVQVKGAEDGTAKGQCMVALAVGPGARVDIGATAGTDTQFACDTVNDVATIVEPKLPKDGG